MLKLLPALITGLALLATGAPAMAQPKAPPKMVGEWAFGPDGEGSPGCVLTFGAGSTIGGFQLTAPKTCAKAFKGSGDLFSWDVDPKGDIILRDAVRRTVLRFNGDGTGAYSAQDKGTVYLLSKEGRPPTLAERMSGHWRLVALGGAPLCDYTLPSAPNGMAGTLKMLPGCKAPWAARNFSAWSLKGRRLTLSDAAGKATLAISDCGLGGCDGELPNGDFVGFTPIFE